MRAFEKDIKMIVIDSPGLCYVVLEDFAFPSIEKISNIYNKMKEDKKIYNTPIMFFSKNIFQMLVLSNFRNNPLEFYKICNINEWYKKRKIYINGDYTYFFHESKNVRQLILTAISELAIHINEIDITCEFASVKDNLFSILLQILQFNLYLKNGKILSNYSDIIREYDSDNYVKEIISIFDDGNTVTLSSAEKTFKVIVFIKKLKSEIMKNYE